MPLYACNITIYLLSTHNTLQQLRLARSVNVTAQLDCRVLLCILCYVYRIMSQLIPIAYTDDNTTHSDAVFTMPQVTMRVTVVGDECTNKSHLLYALINGLIPVNHAGQPAASLPRVVENVFLTLDLDGVAVHVVLNDTTGIITVYICIVQALKSKRRCGGCCTRRLMHLYCCTMSHPNHRLIVSKPSGFQTLLSMARTLQLWH